MAIQPAQELYTGCIFEETQTLLTSQCWDLFLLYSLQIPAQVTSDPFPCTLLFLAGVDFVVGGGIFTTTLAPDLVLLPVSLLVLLPAQLAVW